MTRLLAVPTRLRVAGRARAAAHAARLQLQNNPSATLLAKLREAMAKKENIHTHECLPSRDKPSKPQFKTSLTPLLPAKMLSSRRLLDGSTKKLPLLCS